MNMIRTLTGSKRDCNGIYMYAGDTEGTEYTKLLICDPCLEEFVTAFDKHGAYGPVRLFEFEVVEDKR